MPLDSKRLTDNIVTVYNMRVAEDHTYFVGSPLWGFSVWAHNTCEVNPVSPEGYNRVYRAVSEAEYQDILKHGRLRPGPNSLEGKWFADSLSGAHLHGKALEGAGKYRIIEADVPNNASSLFRQMNLDGRGPARYLGMDDLRSVILHDLTGEL